MSREDGINLDTLNNYSEVIHLFDNVCIYEVEGCSTLTLVLDSGIKEDIVVTFSIISETNTIISRESPVIDFILTE